MNTTIMNNDQYKWPRGYWAGLSRKFGTTPMGARHKVLKGVLSDAEMKEAKTLLKELRSKQGAKQAEREKKVNQLLNLTKNDNESAHQDQ
jgi:hypothetical protein